MKTKQLFILCLALVMLLSACSLNVSKDEPEAKEELEPAEVTKNLPEERKVREIELYVTTADYDPVRYEFGLMIADEWRKLGFNVKVTPLAWNRLAELGLKQKDFDAFTLSWSGRAERIDPDHFIYGTLHSSNDRIGAYNIVGYQNPEYDKLAELQRTTVNADKRREYVLQAQEIAAEDQPYSPVGHRNQIMAYNSKDFTNVEYMMGEGLNSFWTYMSATPTGDEKVIKWGYPSDINSFNILNSVATHDFHISRLIYDRLFRIDSTGKAELWAAESFEEVGDSGTVFDIKIRSGMNFHDGQPVTAEDVKFSFEFIQKVEAPYFLNMVKTVENVEVLDELTVRVTLQEPFAPFVANTLGQLYILPKHVWQPIYDKDGAQGVLEYANTEPIGSGPFKVDYWRKDEEMALVRNDDYFKPAKVEGILHIPYANVQGLVAGVQSGETDIAGWWMEPIQAEQLEQEENLTVVRVQDHGFYHINYNMRRMPFDDKAVRVAMAHGIPKEKIINQILEGEGTVADSIIGPANEFWTNSDVKEIRHNLEKARQILQDAGYEWDENGNIYYPEGKSDQGMDRGILREPAN
jgi:peptide/nickel transport system substrate-binding protein